MEHQAGVTEGSILSSDHMWDKFVVSSFSAERFFSGLSGFLISSETNIKSQIFEIYDPGFFFGISN